MYAERLPPHDLDAEEAVIGSLLIEGEALSHVSHFLKPEDFYRDRNRWCYEACLVLLERGEAINQITVSHEIQLQGHLDEVGGPSYLSHLVTTVPTSVHIEHYARIVNRLSVLRQVIGTGGEIASLGYEKTADIEAVLSRAEDLVFQVRSGREIRDFVPLKVALDPYLEEATAPLEATARRDAPIYSGFGDLDRLLGGLQRGDMVVLASRPSLGKSTLALNVARHAAGLHATVAIFSLEMGCEQLALRLLSGEAGVDSHRLRLNLLTSAEEERIVAGVGTLSDLPVFIDDSPIQTAVSLRSKVRRLHLERRVDFIIVDYMQLLSGRSRSENRVQEMSDISRSLKAIARDLNVPLLALSQLSRDVEHRERERRRPRLADLRESGAIEQDADVVVFIYREDKNFTEEAWTHLFPDKPYPQNIAELIVAKHRHGPVGSVELYFDERLARFRPLQTPLEPVA